MIRTGEPVLLPSGGSTACNRADLSAWAEQGGPLPMTLSEHILKCSACADRVRRVSEVSAGLMLLCTQTPPLDLTARANGRALRFLRKAARASTAAHRLLRIRPHLTRYQRACVHAARLSVGAAAALLTLLMRTGILSGFEQTRQIGEQLAQRHWERQIDPTGEWMGPRNTT